MPDNHIARLRYKIGNGMRFISRSWCQYSISPEDVTTIFGCSFGDGGWQHIRRTLSEFDIDPSISPTQSTLGYYLEKFCPSSISILAGVTEEEPLPLFVYPWGTFNNGSYHSAKDANSSRFCGPSTAAFVVEEFLRTIHLYKKMKMQGYRPSQFPNSHMGGTWLEASDGRKRFVVMQGNHRMAVLAHLGARRIEVRSISQALTCVRENNIARWPLVASGRCSIDHARRVFRMFFLENGWHVANLVRLTA
jgi:hypothetical protein